MDPPRAICSAEFAHLYGYEDDDFRTYGQWLHAIHPEERGAALQSLSHSIRSGEAWVEEFRITRKDGAVRWMSGRGQCFYDNAGKPIRVIGVNIDITERKLAEEALRNSEKLAATGRLAATIAHEINNPLEAVGNLIYLAQHDADLSATAKNYLQLADQELERVTHIARQTLGFYRDSSSPVRVNIRESLQDVLRLFERKLKYKSLKTELEVPQDLEINALRGEVRRCSRTL